MTDTQFYLYAGGLAISGIILLALAAIGLGQQRGTRIVTALLGAAFTGYGGYLLLFFKGGEVRVFYLAFLLPVLLIINAVRTYRAQQAQSSQEDQNAAVPPAESDRPTQEATGGSSESVGSSDSSGGSSD